jgi:site-specific recombinase XerC
MSLYQSALIENFLLDPEWNQAGIDAPHPEMTIADFVRSVFVPEHVSMKKLSGRTHYQAILKHVLTPKEVSCIFQETEAPNTKLKTLPDWPYLSNTRLCDTRPEHVQQLITAALMRGYSTQTAGHIRNVVSAIYSHAQRRKLFTGENPASRVTLPKMSRKAAHVLTLAQSREVLGVMQYPERDLAFMAMLIDMNVTEICGLQWKYVNLSEQAVMIDGECISSKTIAVRKRWYRSQLSDVNGKSRQKNLPIPSSLLPLLLEFKHRRSFTGPDDFVFVTRTGSPISAKHLAARRLKSVGRELQMPWLSWQVFHRTRTALLNELRKQVHEHLSFVSVQIPVSSFAGR